MKVMKVRIENFKDLKRTDNKIINKRKQKHKKAVERRKRLNRKKQANAAEILIPATTELFLKNT